MSESNALSANALKTVLTDIHEHQHLNRNNAKRHAAWFAGGLVAGAILPVVLPFALAGLAAIAANIVTFVAANKLVQDVGRGSVLKKLAASVTENNFVSKLKDRAGKLMKTAAKTRRVANYAFYATVGLAVCLFIPPVAPVAAAFYGLGVLGTAAAIGINSWFDGSKVAAVQTAQVTFAATGGEASSPASSLASAPSLGNTPSPSIGFTKAVNNNAPPAAKDEAKAAKINPLKP